MEGKTVLIVEDEPTIQSMVKKYFEIEGFNVITADDGFTALEEFDKNIIDLICLDIMMPNVDGWAVTEAIRETSNVPIIMMTALSSEENILKGYQLNVDDYITKPFNPKILVAKSKTLLNRIAQPTQEEKKLENVLFAGPIEINLDTLVVKIDDKTKDISRTEFDLLKYFLENKGQVCSRDSIFEAVWGESSVETRIVDTYIKKLRKLLGEHSTLIKTVFGLGYRFEVDHEKV